MDQTKPMKPTPEQEQAIAAVRTLKGVKINAYAGTGKTSTLKQIARDNSHRNGTYIAFNKSIADEAKKEFTRNVMCSTQHALAFREIVKQGFDPKKMTGGLNGGYLAKRLNLQPINLTREVKLSARQRGFLIAQTVQRWMRSGQAQIMERHVPLDGKLKDLEAATALQLQNVIAADARRLWVQMSDPKSDMPLSHDGYLKLYAMSRPTIPGDFIMLDEAQDTNGVCLELMRAQSAQLVCVGDRHQQIYEWRGALNAMDLLKSDIEVKLSTSFRFGTGIADYATEILELLNETTPLRGNPQRTSYIGACAAPNAILFRSNGRMLERVFGLIEQEQRPHVCGGVSELLSWVTATEKLMARLPVEMPLEFFGFLDWDDVKFTSQLPGEDELARWVKLVEDHGIEKLRKTLEALPGSEHDADVVLSTGHKSKGREWDAVQLEDDFLKGVRTKEDDQQKRPLDAVQRSEANTDAELRLFYVAATRGRVHLDVPGALTTKLNQVRDLRKQEKTNAAA